jgi:hypothetical protein
VCVCVCSCAHLCAWSGWEKDREEGEENDSVLVNNVRVGWGCKWVSVRTRVGVVQCACAPVSCNGEKGVGRCLEGSVQASQASPEEKIVMECPPLMAYQAYLYRLPMQKRLLFHPCQSPEQTH